MTGFPTANVERGNIRPHRAVQCNALRWLGWRPHRGRGHPAISEARLGCSVRCWVMRGPAVALAAAGMTRLIEHNVADVGIAIRTPARTPAPIVVLLAHPGALLSGLRSGPLRLRNRRLTTLSIGSRPLLWRRSGSRSTLTRLRRTATLMGLSRAQRHEHVVVLAPHGTVLFHGC